MSLNESIVEDAALEWFLLRSAPLNYGGQVGELGYTLGHGAAFAQLRRGKPFLAPSETAAERESFSEVVLVGRLREAIRQLNFPIPEEARAAIKRYLKTRFERRVNP
jgi:type I restriction enzyme R subunit